MNQLARFQIYLEPGDIQVLDEIAISRGVSRSQIIRDAVRKEAVKQIRKSKSKISYLEKLIGSGSPGVSNLAENVDEIYLHD